MQNEAEVSAQLRHRLANALQLLTTLGRMRLSRAQDPEARRQLAWLLDAMGTLGVLNHRVGAADAEDFAGFLTEMEPVWRRRLGARPVRLEVTAEPVVVRENSAAALAVIVNELVSNAISHAFEGQGPGVIAVDLRAVASDSAELVVSDDGCGYDVSNTDRSRLGLWLVSGLADQLRGDLDMDTGRGVRARLSFPLA